MEKGIAKVPTDLYQLLGINKEYGTDYDVLKISPYEIIKTPLANSFWWVIPSNWYTRVFINRNFVPYSIEVLIYLFRLFSRLWVFKIFTRIRTIHQNVPKVQLTSVSDVFKVHKSATISLFATALSLSKHRKLKNLVMIQIKS